MGQDAARQQRLNAVYDPVELPSTDTLITALGKLPQNKVYGDFESVIFRGLTELGVKT
jgi:hypothetical protein